MGYQLFHPILGMIQIYPYRNTGCRPIYHIYSTMYIVYWGVTLEQSTQEGDLTRHQRSGQTYAGIPQ